MDQTLSKNLGDKDKQKRKMGGKELELIIKKHLKNKEEVEINNIIKNLTEEFIESIYPSIRQGGLYGLSICGMVLYVFIKKKNFIDYLKKIVTPILKCFEDKNKNVRFSAMEALFNLSKNCRRSILDFFPQIFDGICKLSGDGDSSVKNGNFYLTRLIKDLVTEDRNFDVSIFVNLLKERIYINNEYIREFLIGWIQLIQMCPNFDLLPYLPQFLDGLFKFLGDENKEILLQTENVLNEFLNIIITVDLDNSAQIKTRGSDEIGICKIIPILLVNCHVEEMNTRRIALTWIEKLLLSENINSSLLEFTSQILSVILENISYKNKLIRDFASKANAALMEVIKEPKNEKIEYDKLISLLKSELNKFSIHSRTVGLMWINTLLKKDADQILKHRDELFSSLVKTLKDPSNEIVQLVLEVLAIIGTTEENFKLFLANLISSFCTDEKLFLKAGLIVKKLSLLLNPEKVFVEISYILSTEKFYNEKLKFSREFIRKLNYILLTSKELSEMRSHIIKSQSSQKGDYLFNSLYKSWVHNPISTLSLCLLAQNYFLASKLVLELAEFEVSVKFFVEIDNIVNFMESPIFTHVRLKLLKPTQYPYLISALYGILMILPQSTAYEKLSRRLQGMHNLILISNILEKENKQEDKSKVKLLNYFKKIRKVHSRLED